VTFDIVAGTAARSAGGRSQADGMVRTNRPFESPVLDVAVISSDDGHATALLELMTAVVGNQVLQERDLCFGSHRAQNFVLDVLHLVQDSEHGGNCMVSIVYTRYSSRDSMGYVLAVIAIVVKQVCAPSLSETS
jgi:hypothetical protein